MKSKFNNEGFFGLQYQLYQLNDSALIEESDKIKHNFCNWVFENFELSQTQLAYLTAIHCQLLKDLAVDTSFAMENRIPISLNKVISEETKFRLTQNSTRLKSKSKHRMMLCYYKNDCLQIDINDE